MIPLLVALLFCTVCVSSERGSKDLVENIPGLIFKPNYKTYSGYLHANEDKTWKMHYLLTTSRSNNESDPVLFWFNGGPGASSLIVKFIKSLYLMIIVSCAFEELGPAYIDIDGKTLFENVYSWNTAANVVFMESPIGVGFSYDTKNVTHVKASDDLTAEQNYNAIFDFFNDSHPEYKDRDFYLAGESYAGMYIPLLASKIAGSLDNFSNKNFRGVLIGNGFMHVRLNRNTEVPWMYYHGLIGEEEWLTLKECCKDQGTDMDNCDYFSFDDDPSKKECSEISRSNQIYGLDDYNLHQDCYSKNLSDFRSQLKLSEQERKDPARYFNYQSTDETLGYSCYSFNAIGDYFNQDHIGEAFNIDNEFYTGGGAFDITRGIPFDSQYLNMTEQFHSILNTLHNFKILIYNGDSDFICNHLGAARFIKQTMEERQATSNKRKAWYFRGNLAGYNQRYIDSNNSTIDVLTVKGAGHMVPMDRPGPALQMLTRFLAGAESYGDYNDNDPGVPKAQPYIN